MAKPKPKPDDKEQSERFKDAARKAEVDQTGKLFESAFRKIVPAARRNVKKEKG